MEDVETFEDVFREPCIKVSAGYFMRLLAECHHLREQVKELQAISTVRSSLRRGAWQRFIEKQEEHRTNDITWQVSEFHREFGYPVRWTPIVPSLEEAKLRLRLISEEFIELLGAFKIPETKAIQGLLNLHIHNCPEPTGSFDVVEAADALGDLDYVVEGTRLTLGIPRQPVANEIQRSNMAKRGGPVDENGKQLKPEGWEPPNIRAAIYR